MHNDALECNLIRSDGVGCAGAISLQATVLGYAVQADGSFDTMRL